jgi:hypothetical protein
MEPGEALSRAPIFQHLSRSSLESVAKVAKVRRFSAGDVLVKEGQDATAFFVIVNGEAEVVKGLGQDDAVTLAQLSELDFFGEMALLDGFPRSASVRALSECECIVSGRIPRWRWIFCRCSANACERWKTSSSRSRATTMPTRGEYLAHLGLHAGDVMREQDPDGRINVYGGAVNIASRISGISAPGEVLVSDIVRGLARTSAGVTCEDRGDQSLKGVGEPLRVWAVIEGQ